MDGDTTIAPDGGSCATLFGACFGEGLSEGNCELSPNPACCSFYTCAGACDANMNGQLDNLTEFDCYCTNDGMACIAEPPGSMTCVGLNAAGLGDFDAWQSCWTEACQVSCGG
jgi:hypothetical protein